MDKAEAYNLWLSDSMMTELSILKSIRHHLIANLYFAWQDTEWLYLATEFVQGGDLRHLMKSKKTFPEDAAKFIIANLILGLEFIHHNGILHRDIRPENILIASTGYLKICDFG